MTIATLFPFLLGSLILLYSASLACKYRPHGLLPVATLCLCLFCGLVALLSGRVVHLPRRREKEEQSGLAHMPRESRAGNERRACS